ncbi:hypothetical protein D1631_09770 [Chryseobacterium nematophagum]|uniref:Uncharacterized protein n=1 Tax=Chryseobacterium nematophagum TaxID=2305228 RepID=A0A3M7TFZ8_9FLAO|nr:hypothetical protein [Chryseobacterium nematophagum]RNA62198.1 hypothetical protein D1631_09770 [Chryseobacterium nematophagum]
MDRKKIVQILRCDHFTEVANNGIGFEEGATIYAKEIKENIFLLFIISKEIHSENIKALIANFDSFKSIGIREPKQIMFYLFITSNQDLHYFGKHLQSFEI